MCTLGMAYSMDLNFVTVHLYNARVFLSNSETCLILFILESVCVLLLLKDKITHYLINLYISKKKKICKISPLSVITHKMFLSLCLPHTQRAFPQPHPPH